MAKTPSSEYKPDPADRYFDLFAALVLVFAMFTASLRLSATLWADYLEVTQGIVFWATIAGMAVGQSKFSPRAAFLFCLDYGVVFVPWRLGALIYSDKISWNERLLSMFGRIQVVITQLSQRQQVSDNMLFLALMSILFWILGCAAGYMLVRRAGMWRVVVPAGFTVLVIQAFDPLLPRRAWYLASYLFLALLLVARMQFLANTRRWRANRTHVSSDASYDLTRVALGVVLVLVLLAWNTPAMAQNFPFFSSFYRSRVEPARQRLADRMSYMFSSLQSSVGLVSDFYGDQMTLGTGIVHTDNMAMTVEAPSYMYEGQRYFWRARVYDQYQDGHWATSITSKQEYVGGVDLPIPDSPERAKATFSFKPQLAIATMYSAAQPLSFSRPGELQLARNPDGTQDIVAIEANPYIHSGEIYQITASLPSFTEKELREAGTNYPLWVTERYLQLPPEITPRTRELARRLAADKDNPYDIVQAITVFLRDNIEYSETIDAPPENQEPIDWFLFTYQKGFCNYYSTAEIILLRSLGIPARWAVGYAQGDATKVTQNPFASPEEMNRPELLEEVTIYSVRQKEAHAWPEVYFPGLGWVEFEPTVSQDPIVRPSGEETSTDDFVDPSGVQPTPPFQPPPDDSDPLKDLSDENANQPGLSPLSLAITLVVLGLAVGLLGLALFARQRRLPAWLAIERVITGDSTPLPVRLERNIRRLGLRPPDFLVNWAQMTLLPALSRAYLEIDRALHRLGTKTVSSLTPAERAATLVALVPQAGQPVERLLAEYQLGTYSPYEPDVMAAIQAGYEIRRLSWIALFQKFLARFQEPEDRKSRMRGLYEQ